MSTRSLAAWLQHIDRLHGADIVMGLERVEAVAARLKLDRRPAAQLVTVAGTNGKGSCIAALESIALAQGVRTAAYTSPHLLHFGERLRIAGKPLSDAHWCEAFARVEQAACPQGGRDIALTFFEFTTLAALWLIARQDVELALLEIGLGGRLDAVNIVSPDVAVLCSVDLDHRRWLGEDRESIGAEKAAIFRSGCPAVCGDPEPPASVLRMAEQRGSRWYGRGEAFNHMQSAEGVWQWRGTTAAGRAVTHRSTDGPPQLDADSVATALQAWYCLSPQLDEEAWKAALRVTLPGRFQRLRVSQQSLILDVAHNPAAAQRLVQRLRAACGSGRFAVICGMLADKDATAFAAALSPAVATWYPTAPVAERALPAAVLAQHLGCSGVAVAEPAPSVAAALTQACERAGAGATIVVCGSFYTVAEALHEVQVAGDFAVREVA